MISNKNICSDIANALGLGHCKSIDIRMRYDELVMITAVWSPKSDTMVKLPDVLKKYRLVEIEKNDAIKTIEHLGKVFEIERDKL